MAREALCGRARDASIHDAARVLTYARRHGRRLCVGHAQQAVRARSPTLVREGHCLRAGSRPPETLSAAFGTTCCGPARREAQVGHCARDSDCPRAASALSSMGVARVRVRVRVQREAEACLPARRGARTHPAA